MITIIKNPEAQERARQICGLTFLKHTPKCRRSDVFAAALHNGLGWRIVALTKDDGGPILHTLLENPAGGYFDPRGEVAERDIGKLIDVEWPYRLHIIEAADLPVPAEVAETHATVVADARRLAETAWPDLPWLDSLMQRAERFAEALETLCLQHGFFIRGNCPGSEPILYHAYGAEKGFTLKPLAGGSQFLLDRMV